MLHIYLSKRNLILLLAVILVAAAAPVVAQYCVQDPSTMSPLAYSLNGYCKRTLISEGGSVVGCSGSFPATCTSGDCACTAGYTLVRTGSHFVPNSSTTRLSARFYSCMKDL